VLRLLLQISLAWISLSLLGTLLWVMRVELARLVRRFGGASPTLRPLIHARRSFGR
jgi:hypothetical protein